jgi:hypothetical protein
MQQARAEGVVHLHAQPAHGNVDGIGAAVEIDAPDMRGQVHAGLHFAVLAHQSFKQREFNRREPDALTFAQGLAA